MSFIVENRADYPRRVEYIDSGTKKKENISTTVVFSTTSAEMFKRAKKHKKFKIKETAWEYRNILQNKDLKEWNENRFIFMRYGLSKPNWNVVKIK